MENVTPTVICARIPGVCSSSRWKKGTLRNNSAARFVARLPLANALERRRPPRLWPVRLEAKLAAVLGRVGPTLADDRK
eukprot:15460834-Alexandrium_andersonii.AAC.1